MIRKTIDKLKNISAPKYKKSLIYFKDPFLIDDFLYDDDELEIKVLDSIMSFENLVKNNYRFDFSTNDYLKNSIKKGCILICIFKNLNLVHLSMMTFNYPSKKYIDPISVIINKHKCAFWGNAFTEPKNRGKGYSKISLSECFKLCRNKKITRLIWSVTYHNKPAIKAYSYFKPITYGASYSVNILWYYLKYIKRIN